MGGMALCENCGHVLMLSNRGRCLDCGTRPEPQQRTSLRPVSVEGRRRRREATNGGDRR